MCQAVPALSVVPAVATAAEVPAPGVSLVSFDIKPQPIGTALNELAKRAGIQVLFFTDVANDITTSALVGSFTPEEALSKLLSNTGLTYTYINARTVAIHNQETSSVSANKEAATLKMRLANYQILEAAGGDVVQAPTAGSSQSPNRETSHPERRNAVLEEIIVTAQKREERLRDTPISIGVLSGEVLEASSARGITDVLNQVGGVSVTETQPGQAQVVLRGVVPGAGSSTAAYYQDEVPFAFNRFADLPDTSAFDLSRIEVLRGPQGTLYGANSLSGVVRVLANDADLNAFAMKGRMRASSTESGDENYAGDAALNVPLIPGKLAVRAVAGYSDLSGFIDSSMDGKNNINDTQAQNYRLRVNWQPTENFSAKLGYSRSDVHNNAPSLAFDDFTTPFSSNQATDRVMDIYSLVAEYKWSNVSLLSSTGYIDYKTSSRLEELLGGGDAINYLDDELARAFSQEIRLVSNFSGSWQWSAGGFYRDSNNKVVQDVRPIFTGLYEQGSISESYALFGELTRFFDDGKFKLTAGLRYANDRETIQDLGTFFPGEQPLQPDKTVEFDHVTGRLVLSYKPDESSMIYGSVATGFRGGLLQAPAVTAVAPDLKAVDPDSLISYEVGAKGTLLDGVIAWEGAVYYTDWTDTQQSLILPIGFFARVNAGDASGLGVDATLSYQPTRALTLWTSVGWNDLKLSKDVLSDGVVLFQKDSRLNNSPERTGAVGASYRAPTAKEGLDVVLSGNFAYGSQRLLRYLTAGVVNETLSDDYRSVKASIGLAADRWTLDLYGDNLTNDGGAITPPDTNTAGTSVRQRPRTIGLQLTIDY